MNYCQDDHRCFFCFFCFFCCFAALSGWAFLVVREVGKWKMENR